MAAKRRGQDLGLAKDLKRQINKSIAKSVQECAVGIANSLAQNGPAWSGAFSASWDVVIAGGTPAPSRGEGRIYQYTKRNFPASRYEKALNASIGGPDTVRFEIVNSSPYADIAIDEEESVFFPDGAPIGDVVRTGFRPKDDVSLRGQVSDDPNGDSRITAPPFWFQTYYRGGALSLDLAKGVELGFR